MYSSKDRSGFGSSVGYLCGIGAGAVITTDSFTFCLFHAFFGGKHASGDPRSRAKPRIIAGGLGVEGNARRKGCVSFLLCSLEQGMWCSSCEQGPSPKGTFCPSPALSPGWKAAGCYNRPQRRLPSLQETRLFFVILLALLPVERQPTFFFLNLE